MNFNFSWLLCAVLCLSACGDPSNSKVAVETQVTDPMEVVVSESQEANYKTAEVQMGWVVFSQTHPGRIEVNERLVNRIGASLTGRITAVQVETGDVVSPGQLLAQISSPELTTSQLTYLRASAALALAERAVERAKQMIQADVISSAEFQKRESELSIARAEQRAAEDQLRLLGLPSMSIDRLRDQGRIQPEGDVRAKQGGVVVERKVSAGQVVQPGDSLFTIADLSSVWAVASLPEQAARYVSKNQTVAIEIPALDTSFKGEIVFISDTVQPETRTVAIRTQLSNPKRDIKPMMLMNMKVDSNGKMVPLIPSSAVVRDNDRDHVFVQIQPRIFRLTPVDLEPAVEGNRPVLKGLTQGEMVVTEGAFHLNNDRVQRLLTSQPAAPKPGSKPQVAK